MAILESALLTSCETSGEGHDLWSGAKEPEREGL